MQRVAIVILVVAAGLGAFAWWGMFTASGKHQFDEMAGMIPLGVGVLAIVSIVIRSLQLLFVKMRSH